MKFAFMQNPLTQIPFFAWIYNSFIISHILEWLKVRQIKSGIRVNFDQCVRYTLTGQCLSGSSVQSISYLSLLAGHDPKGLVIECVIIRTVLNDDSK